MSCVYVVESYRFVTVLNIQQQDLAYCENGYGGYFRFFFLMTLLIRYHMVSVDAVVLLHQRILCFLIYVHHRKQHLNRIPHTIVDVFLSRLYFSAYITEN